MNTYHSFRYFPHTKKNIEEMLESIGIKKIDDLFHDIPESIRIKSLDLESEYTEKEIRERIIKIGKKNYDLKCFRGYGSYEVNTPSIIDALISREEYLTAYTPYQPEISQGTLQYIFEYQSIVCELTGLDVANASMYDGATSTAEAALMACNQTRRKTVIVSNTLNENYLNVLKTYLLNKNYNLVIIPMKDYLSDYEKIIDTIDSDTAAVMIQYPNCYGYLEDIPSSLTTSIHNNKSLLITVSDITTLALLKSPKEYDADIACGEAQALGIPLYNGGPYIGYLACKESLMRKMPGRIVGMTTDTENKRGYVLTLQAREQHIRREKATSNICSNESLMALYVTIYCALLGKKGLIDSQKLCYQNSHYLEDSLLNNIHFKKVTSNEYLKEFLLQTTYDIDKLNTYLLSKGYLGGINIGNGLYLLCATETKTKKQIDEFVKVIGEYNE